MQELYHSIVRVVSEEELAADLSEIDDLKALLQWLDDVVWALAAATAPEDSAGATEELKQKTLEEFDEASWDWIVYGTHEMASKSSIKSARAFLEEKLTAILAQLAPEGDSIAPTASIGLSGQVGTHSDKHQETTRRRLQVRCVPTRVIQLRHDDVPAALAADRVSGR